MNVQDAIAQRRSCRAYRSDPVPHELVRQVLEAARLAPSACNKQPWRFAVVTDPVLRRRIVKKGIRRGLGMAWAEEAPVLIVLGMHRSPGVHRLARWVTTIDYPWLDMGIAGEHIVLQAEELGLATCWIGWINCRALRRIVGWPSTVRPCAVITLGWAADSGEPPPRTPRKEMDELLTWRQSSAAQQGC